MSRSNPQRVILDATVLSNYAVSESIEFLIDVIPDPWTVPAVEEELRKGYEDGYVFLENALVHIMFFGERIDPHDYDYNYDTILMQNIPVRRDEIKRQLDQGEAEALYFAMLNGYVLATDDGDARNLSDEYNVSITGSLGVLVRGIKMGEVTISVANNWLTEWKAAGYYSPVDDVRELVEESDNS